MERRLAGWRGFVVGFLAVASLQAARADPSNCRGEIAEAGVVEAVGARALRLKDARTLKLAGIELFDVLLPDARDAGAKLQGRLLALVDDGALRFRLLATEADRYGRLPALVWVDGRMLQEVFAREGLAVAFANGALPCFDRIMAAENAARRAERGFWKGERLPWAVPSALVSRIGHFAIFEGRVLSVGNRPSRTYLNFGRRWTQDVTAEIAAESRDSFGGEAALAALAGKRVRVRGFLEEKGGPMVVLGSPAQLEVLDSPADETKAGGVARSP